MTIVEFLARLSDQGIKLWVENERLRYRAPQEVMTEAVRAEIAQRRDAILSFLRQTQARSQEQIATIPVVPRQTPLPLSFAQERLWFLDQWHMGSTAYHVPLLVRLHGRLDRDALQRSMSGVMQRHESLRTTIGLAHNQPLQVIHAATPLNLHVHDLRQLPADDRESAAARLVREAMDQPFDLAQGPLTRIMLLQCAETDHLLLVVMHHIITDGWSMHILTQEVSELYRAAISGAAPNLPALPIQYADFAYWQRGRLQGTTLERSLAYWKNQLQGAPDAIRLPTDRPRPPVQTFRAASASFTLSSTLTADLNALGQHEDATLFMVLLTGFMCLLARASGQSDVVVVSPIANRTHAAIKGLIGFFVNMLMLRADLGDNPPCIDALRRVRRVCLEGYAHQELPFDRIVEVLQPERGTSDQPLVQVVFVLQNNPSASVELPHLTLTPIEVASTSAKFDLTLTMTEEHNTLRGIVEYSVDLFEAATIERFVQHFEALLQEVVREPSQRVLDLPILSSAEQAALIQRWNSNRRTAPKTIVDRAAPPQPDQERRRGEQEFAAPGDELEAHVARIWETILDVRPIGVDDDFFALGGHSLAAMRLMAQIEQQFGLRLPVAALLRGATVATIATAIRQQRTTPTIESVVPIQATGHKAPFFCMHPAGGDVLCYQALATHFGTERPFYALQAAGLHGEQEPDPTVEAMAARYLAAIRAYQTDGPYYLGGWSLGGIVAFEVAQQLQAQGHRIAKLVLLDSQLSGGADSAIEGDLELLGSFAQHLGLRIDQIAPLSDPRVDQAPEERLAAVVEQLHQAHLLPSDVTISQLAQRFHVFRAHIRALRRYQPRPFDGHATLIQAREQPGNEEAAATWARVVARLTVYTAAGSHLTMVRPPHVVGLAQMLADCLDSH
ncbi:MAG TPA: condensation domain-containing protein [Herpetosiphonaceae bacterium]